MKRKFNFYGIALFLLSFAITINAQNLNDAFRLAQPSLGISARAMGMGNAFSAVGGDFSASYYNPAGLGLIKKSELMGGFNYNSIKNNTTFFNNTSDFTLSNTTLNQFGFAFPFPVVRGSLVAAFGYNRSHDFSNSLNFNAYNRNNNSMIQDLAFNNSDLAYELGLSYPLYDGSGNYMKDTTLINGSLNQRGSLIDEGGIDNWTLAGAVEIAKNVFAGVTLNIISGSYKSTRDYYEEDVNDNYTANLRLDPEDSRTADFQSFYFNDNLGWDISGWEVKLGLLYSLNKNINLSTAIKFPTFFTIKESYSVYGESYFGNASFNFDPAYYDEIEYDIKTPYEFSLGISGKLAGLRLSADFNFIDYTQLKFDGGLDAALEAANNRDIRREFRSVVNYSTGLEFKLPIFGITLRSGYILNKSPYKVDGDDFNKKFYTFGLGFKPDRNIALDFAYLRGSWKDYSDNYGVNLSRVEQNIDKNRYVLTITYNY